MNDVAQVKNEIRQVMMKENTVYDEMLQMRI